MFNIDLSNLLLSLNKITEEKLKLFLKRKIKNLYRIILLIKNVQILLASKRILLTSPIENFSL